MARIDAFRNHNSNNKDEINLKLKSNQMIIDEEVNETNYEANDTNNNHMEGLRVKEEIEKKMNKIQEPQQPKTKKPLPKPDDKPRRTRGGRTKRSIKARTERTELRLMKNRMKFGPEAELEFRDTGKGFGLLAVGGAGSKLKTNVKNIKINTKKMKGIQMQNEKEKEKSGLHSSIAFTPSEGIELINPDLLQNRYNKAKEKYFSDTSGFTTVINSNLKKN
jgi:U4/U6 small nuclear ribonucleoprotein PRP31